MMMTTDPLYLYILMRTDLASLNPGKAVAQGTHAANQMVHEGRSWAVENASSETEIGREALRLEREINEWEDQSGKGFGTCIVLGVNEKEMRRIVDQADAAGLHAGICHDPSYPLTDGETTHLIPLDTCAYLFARKLVAAPFVDHLKLMA